MLNFSKVLPKDRFESAKQTRAKLYDEERKKRIFNPAIRTIGIDKEFLDKQIQEKQILRNKELEIEAAYSKKLLQDCEISMQLEEQKKKKQKQIDIDILTFRKKFQTPATRREFDLNNSLECKTGQPNRVDDNDPIITVSSFQRFDSEMDTKEQRAEQKLQQRVWLEMQIREKNMAKEEDMNVERTRQEVEHTTAQRAHALASLEKECRRKLMKANQRYNQALAAEQRSNRHIAEVENAEDKNAEVYNAVTGDFLTENQELAFNSALGPGKITASLYKGLTPARRQMIYDEQAKQREELKARKKALQKQEKNWADLLTMLARSGTLSDREMQKKKRTMEDEIKNFNLILADEQKNKQEFMNELYRTKASDDFFKQFNTTTR